MSTYVHSRQGYIMRLFEDALFTGRYIAGEIAAYYPYLSGTTLERTV